ncbi:MAG: PAS domain-containing protein [Magnetovibrio sp.]|nr:PAS domain-containing protein [Magnetovibrio sp.]
MLKNYGGLSIISGIAIGVLLTAGWLAYGKIEAEVKTGLEKTLNTVLQTSRKSLESWAGGVKQEATVWAGLPVTQAFVAHLAEKHGSSINPHRHEVLQKEFGPLSKVHNYLGLYIFRKDNLSATSFLTDNINVLALYAQNKSFFEEIWAGKVVLSLPKRVKPHDQTAKLAVARIFVGAPVRDQENNVVGALVLSLSPQDGFSQILQRGRLGNSGETYAFNASGLLISESRFDAQLRQMNLIKPGQRAALNIYIHDPETNLLVNGPFVGNIHDHPLTRMATHALTFQDGMNLEGYNDYRGVPVVGVWAWDKSLNIAIATEMDAEEAYLFLTSMKKVMIGLTIISTALVGFLFIIYVIGREKLATSEEDLSITLNCIGEGVIATDVSGNVMRMNPVAEKLSGWLFEEAKGRPLEDIFKVINAITKKPVMNPVKKVMASGKVAGLSNHTILLARTGEKLQIADSAAPIRNRKNKICGVVLVFRDVSDEYTMAEELSTALGDAERANQAKSEFLASMSHELRTPMNAVLGFAQMLQFDLKYPLSLSQNEYVENILAGGHHLLELINEILDLARIESDQLPVTVESIDACKIIEDCVALILPLCQPQNIKIIQSADPVLPIMVRTDRLRFKQALLNLHSNAVKYNKQGGTITLKTKEIEAGFLRVYVSDTGVGIPDDEHHSIFNMFHRLGADPTIAREGTGIGLTVTKLLIERLAGHVGFESEEGVGSTFWIELPLASNTKTLIWSDALQVGIGAIDQDHQVIIRLLNKLCRSSVGQSELAAVVEELWDYSQYHFRREETIMKLCEYPHLEHERVAQEKLVSKIESLNEAWQTYQEPEMLENLRTFLRSWWLDHIINVNTELAKYAKGKEQRIRKALNDLE